MKNKQGGFIGVLLIIIIGVGLLYYFQVDVKGMISYYLQNDFQYLSDAKRSIMGVNWGGLFGTSTGKQ